MPTLPSMAGQMAAAAGDASGLCLRAPEYGLVTSPSLGLTPSVGPTSSGRSVPRPSAGSGRLQDVASVDDGGANHRLEAASAVATPSPFVFRPAKTLLTYVRTYSTSL